MPHIRTPKRFAFPAALLIALLALCGAHANAGEKLFEATYKGKYSGMAIKSTRTLTMDDQGGFHIKSEMKNLLASIEERSDFSVEQGVLKPAKYHYQRSFTGFKADEDLVFDWAAGVAKYRRADKPEKNKDHPISLGVLDPVLYQLQLQRDAYSGKKQFNVTFVKPSKVKTLIFEKMGEESFTLGDHTYQAIKIARVNLDDDKQTRVWMIPALNYQIARIEHVEEDGKAYNIYLTEYHSSEKLVDLLYKSNPKGPALSPMPTPTSAQN